jgi:hypothetical protein
LTGSPETATTRPPREGPMQRHLSASKPGDAGKFFFEGMCEGADLFR